MSFPAAESARELRDRMASGEASVVDVLEHSLAAIEQANPELRAFRRVESERARLRAAQLEAGRANEQPGPLFGLPVALKANMCLEGFETDCGSRLLEGWRAPYTASFVERLLAAGAIPVGTTHMDEFAMGSSGENSAFDVPRNPHASDRTCGGSSSGSAAAVAARLVPLALGSDTGGSVRQPAAFTGIVGFKPTYGRIPRHGLVAFASSLDQVSPFACNVGDVELMMSVLAGGDGRDASASRDGGFRTRDSDKIETPRLGFVPAQLARLEADVAAGVRAALEQLESQGAELVEVDLPTTEHALSAYYVIAAAEASANLSRFDGLRFGQRIEGDGSLAGAIAATRGAGFGNEVKRRILLGTFVLSSGYHEAWFGRATRVRRLVSEEHERVFEGVDFLIGPTAPEAAFRLGERERDPLAMYASDALTVPANLAGLPALSQPCGTVTRDGNELPLGLQWTGPRFSDERLLATTRHFEKRLGHGAEDRA